MRRKEDDKRVLRPGNGSYNNNRNSRRNKKRTFRPNNNARWSTSNSRKNKKGKRSGKTVFIMILVLVAFVIGAAIGVSLSFDNQNEDNSTHVENVTVEMTTNLTNETVIFDEEDDIDFNENQSGIMLDENFESEIYNNSY